MTPSMAEAVELARKQVADGYDTDHGDPGAIMGAPCGCSTCLVAKALLAAVELLPTEEEREALEHAVRFLDTGDWFEHQLHDPVVAEHVSRCEESARVISRLLGAK